MRRASQQGDIRIAGADEQRVPRPPRLPVLIGVAIVVVMALAAMLIPHNGSDLAIRIPDLGPETTTTIVPPSSIAIDPSAGDEEASLPNPLDSLVPGLTDTLVLTTATGSGQEVWRWTTGSDGTLTRSPLGVYLFDPTPDLAGDTVAALMRYAREAPWLVMAHDSLPVPVFYGARSFAWHRTDPGRIAWLSQVDGENSPTLYVGAHNDGGLYFQPLTVLAGFDSMSPDLVEDRLVGYDETGFVIERWSDPAGPNPTVVRLDPEGNPAGETPGAFVGLSDTAGVAVSGATATVIDSGLSLAFDRALPAPTSSVVWWTGGTSVAYAPYEGSSVIVISGGSAVREYELGVDHPVAAAWSTDGRFLLATGYVGDTPMLLFVDMADGSIDSIAIDSSPVRAVLVP